jgi:hypothetical protein
MSYDINFWKQSRPLDLPPEEIYTKLCNGERVEGLESLPIKNIYDRIRVAFPGFDAAEEFSVIELEHCGIEVSSSDQHVRFDIRGETGSSINTLVSILADFDCPMYDPQINQRFDKNNGMDIGESPPFEDLTDEEREVQEKQMQELLSKFNSKEGKKGCGRTAIAFLAFLMLIIWLGWKFF